MRRMTEIANVARDLATSKMVSSKQYTIFVLTFIFGSTQMMMVNGQKFTDSFWLRMTDMFINSSLLLLVNAAGVVVFGATRYYRKGHGK